MFSIYLALREKERVLDKVGGGLETKILQYDDASCIERHIRGVLWKLSRVRIVFCLWATMKT